MAMEEEGWGRGRGRKSKGERYDVLFRISNKIGNGEASSYLLSI